MVLDGDDSRIVRFPPRFHALYFGRNFIAGVMVDELEVETPVVFQYPEALR